MKRAFSQVDVFTETPYAGNPVAVVLQGNGLSTEEMQRFARWAVLTIGTGLGNASFSNRSKPRKRKRQE